MKKTICNFLLPAAVLLLAAACTREIKTARVADEGVIALEGYEDTGCSWTYSMDYVTGGVSREVMDKMNLAIIQSATGSDVDDTSTDVPASCLQWVDGIDAEYSEYSGEILANLAEDDSPWMLNWSYAVDGSFTTGCKARKLITYSSASDSYTGGAHGSNYVAYLVFDLTTGELVTESDLFREGFEADIAEPLYDKILEGLDEELWEAIYEAPMPNGNFSVSEEGLTWLFNTYEIGPYVLGPQIASFTWAELEPYLK